MAPKKAKPRPVTWEVVGGAQSGGLIVRIGPETKSQECAERIATGAVIQELELQGERMRYRRVRGAGPETGWISTKFKGKDQLKPRQLRAWILATGTRGDIQPFLALALGMQDRGYDMTIWTCEDYKAFVEGYGVRMFKIAGSVEERIKHSFMEEKKAGQPGQPVEEKSEATQRRLLSARFNYSRESGRPCGGLDFEQKELPPELFERFPKEVLAQHCEDRCGTFYFLGRDKDGEYWAKEAERLAAEATAEKEVKAGEEPEEKPREKEEKKEEEDGVAMYPAEGESPEDWWVAQREKAGPVLRRVMEDAEDFHTAGGDGQSAADALRAFEEQRRYWEGDKFDHWSSLAVANIEGLFVHDMRTEESILQEFARELRERPPDVVMFNMFWMMLGTVAGHFAGVPTIQLCLQTSGLYCTDPAGSWVTPESFPTLQLMDDTLKAYATLEEARQHHVMPEEINYPPLWARYVQWESMLVEPLLNVHPIRDMGTRAFGRALTERHLCGFLSSISSQRFLKMMGEYSQRMCAKHTYTGFWIMEEKHQTGGSAMFGGAELMRDVEAFVAAGAPPAYIGWGSCVCQRGKEWMILLAVGALKMAGMRGIVLGGWAELSQELLEEVVGGSDPELLQYARKNILFIKKAPQVWLFPKCSVVVIHGGVGTLAAAWTSGTPLIVCPVWLDQFTNAFLNVLMGAGTMTAQVDLCSCAELAGYLSHTATDPTMRRGAQAVQLSMLMDQGIQTATEFIDNVVLEEYPSGRWREWWLQ